MADASLYEVTTVNPAASTFWTEHPKEFNEFYYDNQNNGGVIQKLDDAKTKVQMIVDDISEITGLYSKLKDTYEEFDQFFGVMDRFSSTIKEDADNAKKQIDELAGLALTKVEAAAQSDQNLLDDIEALKDLLGIDYDDSSASSASFLS